MEMKIPSNNRIIEAFKNSLLKYCVPELLLLDKKL
jgi:hypothetical protein